MQRESVMGVSEGVSRAISSREWERPVLAMRGGVGVDVGVGVGVAAVSRIRPTG